ncbi:MAG: hypothetical protein K6E42_07415 [Synergistes sp.]|nr:hypothetical protein [Synergistes sp.]
MKKTLSLVILTLLALTVTCCAAFADTPLINRIQYTGNGKVIISFDRDIHVDEHSITVYDYAGRIVPSIIAGSYKRQIVLRLPNAGYNQRYTFEIDGVNAGSGGGLFYSNSFFTRDNWYEDWTSIARDLLKHPGRPGTRSSSRYNGQNQQWNNGSYGMGEGYDNRQNRPYWYENKPGQQPYWNNDRPDHRPRSHDFRPGQHPQWNGDRPDQRPGSREDRPERQPRSHDVRPVQPPQPGQQNKPAQPPQAQNNQQQLRQRVSDK